MCALPGPGPGSLRRLCRCLHEYYSPMRLPRPQEDVNTDDGEPSGAEDVPSTDTKPDGSGAGGSVVQKCREGASQGAHTSGCVHNGGGILPPLLRPGFATPIGRQPCVQGMTTWSCPCRSIAAAAPPPARAWPEPTGTAQRPWMSGRATARAHMPRSAGRQRPRPTAPRTRQAA